MESVLNIDFKQFSLLLGIEPCPKTISIEELKKLLLQIGDKGCNLAIISAVPDSNVPGETYALVYDKKLCAYWIIPDTEEAINLILTSAKSGKYLPDTVEELFSRNN